MASNTPEGKVKELIKKWCKRHDIQYWMVIPSAYGRTTGMSDFIGILKSGKWWAIEAKAPNKRDTVTANQKKFLDTISDNNGVAWVVDSQEDLDNLEVHLKEQGHL